MRELRAVATSKGKAKARLRRKASKTRKRMIREVALNRGLPPDIEKALASSSAKAAKAKYSRFWGLDSPEHVEVFEIPGPKNQVLVGMGTGKAILADGPEGKFTKKWSSSRGRKTIVTNAAGNRIMILSGKRCRDKKQKLTFLGYAAETHYVPTAAMEASGTFKKGKYWVHRHSDKRGKWPKVYGDQAGNLVYGPGTYTIDDWIRR